MYIEFFVIVLCLPYDDTIKCIYIYFVVEFVEFVAIPRNKVIMNNGSPSNGKL